MLSNKPKERAVPVHERAKGPVTLPHRKNGVESHESLTLDPAWPFLPVLCNFTSGVLCSREVTRVCRVQNALDGVGGRLLTGVEITCGDMLRSYYSHWDETVSVMWLFWVTHALYGSSINSLVSGALALTVLWPVAVPFLR